MWIIFYILIIYSSRVLKKSLIFGLGISMEI